MKSINMPQSTRDARHQYSNKSRNAPTVSLEVKSKLAQYVNAKLDGEDEWTRASEIPTEAEVGWIENGKVITDPVCIYPAKIDESYASMDEYLSVQYRLMRADGVLPLARCIDDYRHELETVSKDARVYNEVRKSSHNSVDANDL